MDGGDAEHFACLSCGGEDHEWREALLNTRGLTLLGWSAFNRAATCLVCRRCRHVHWFAQDLEGPRDAIPVVGPGCWACGHTRHDRRRVLLNTRLATFLGVDWLDRQAGAVVCKGCGHLHWHRGGKDWVLPQGGPARDHDATGCIACGGARLSRRSALLNTRPMDLVNLDWLDRGAHVVVCADCRFATWYAKRVK